MGAVPGCHRRRGQGGTVQTFHRGRLPLGPEDGARTRGRAPSPPRRTPGAGLRRRNGRRRAHRRGRAQARRTAAGAHAGFIAAWACASIASCRRRCAEHARLHDPRRRRDAYRAPGRSRPEPLTQPLRTQPLRTQPLRTQPLRTQPLSIWALNTGPPDKELLNIGLLKSVCFPSVLPRAGLRLAEPAEAKLQRQKVGG